MNSLILTINKSTYFYVFLVNEFLISLFIHLLFFIVCFLIAQCHISFIHEFSIQITKE